MHDRLLSLRKMTLYQKNFKGFLQRKNLVFVLTKKQEYFVPKGNALKRQEKKTSNVFLQETLL